MALTRGVAATIQVFCEGASPPVTGSIVGGSALATAPARVGATDWYDVALTADEMDAESFGLSLVDTIGTEFGFTVVPEDLTPERLAKLDGAAQEATVATIPTAEHNAEAVDALLSAIHGAGSWEGGVPTEGVLITQDSIGDDDLPLGPIMPYGTISAYLGEDLAYVFDEIGDANGNFAITLPYGATWTLVATNPPHYRTTTAIITTPLQS